MENVLFIIKIYSQHRAKEKEPNNIYLLYNDYRNSILLQKDNVAEPNIKKNPKNGTGRSDIKLSPWPPSYSRETFSERK